MRSISRSLPRAGITRDLGPHRGRGWGPGAGRPAGAQTQAGRDQRAGGAASGGAAVPPHRVEAGKGESEHGLLQRPQEDEQGWCRCAAQAGSRRPSPASPAHLKARAQVPAAGAGPRLTAPSPPRWPGPKETRAGRRQGRLG